MNQNDSEFQKLIYEVTHRGTKARSRFFETLIYVRNCPIAQKMHKDDPRVFAFYAENRIHFSNSFESLSEENKRGLIAHEIGHFLDDIFPDYETTDLEYTQSSNDQEIRADWFSEKLLSTRIFYDKEKIQWAI